jgi:hypothetical protein
VTTSPTLSGAIDGVSNASRVAVNISIPGMKALACLTQF